MEMFIEGLRKAFMQADSMDVENQIIFNANEAVNKAYDNGKITIDRLMKHIHDIADWGMQKTAMEVMNLPVKQQA